MLELLNSFFNKKYKIDSNPDKITIENLRRELFNLSELKKDQENKILKIIPFLLKASEKQKNDLKEIINKNDVSVTEILDYIYKKSNTLQ